MSLGDKFPIELRMKSLFNVLHHQILLEACAQVDYILIMNDKDKTDRERIGKLNGVIPITQTRVNTDGHEAIGNPTRYFHPTSMHPDDTTREHRLP